MLDYTPEQMMEAVEEASFDEVISGLGHIPHVRLKMSKEFLDQDINALGLPLRAWAGCMRCGATTIGKLVDQLRTREGLSGIRNMGHISIAETKLRLTEAAYNQLSKEDQLEFWDYFLKNSVEHPRFAAYAEG